MSPSENPFTHRKSIERRDFLKLGSISLLGLGLAELPSLSRAADAAQPNPPAKGSLKATFGEPIAYKDLHGDSWTPAWADDENLYSTADDTLGPKDTPINSNLAVYRITGDQPPGIHVEVVNPMPQFGKCTEVKPEDGACWKASSLACIDGVLYLAASRNRYVDQGAFNIQQVWDSSIIKSTDHGKTWSPAPQLGQAMFPGHTFSNPCFVQYGQDGRGTKDASDKFVYAVSNDGSWNNGNSMALGRVPRNRIANLDPHDWEFVHGFEKGQVPIWKPRHDYAIYTLRAPGRAGVGGIHYIAGIDRYITAQWHYPTLNEIPQTVAWNHSRFELYEGPAPWGPWTLFHTQDFKPQGFYNPTIPSKFISADGKKLWIFAAGDFSTSDHPYYTINMIPVTLDIV